MAAALPTIPNIPIFDGHNDTLLAVHLPEFSDGHVRGFFEASEYGHIDFPRARAGGMSGGFFAIFTPSPRHHDAPVPGATGKNTSYAIPVAAEVDQLTALKFTVDLAADLFRIEREGNGALKVVRTVDEMAQCLADGTFAMVFHIEGAEAIDADLNALETLYQAGLRSIGIVWSRPNIFASGVPFAFPSSPDTGPGLTDAGKRLVKACNELGILIDLSHLNEKGFWDVAKLSSAPLVATHSGAHALCASARNLTDKQMDAIRASNGIVGVNFHVGFLRADGGRDGATTPLTEIVRHLDYMVERMGIDHVALGSDFDGAVMPGDLRDVAGLPKLMDALSKAGYDESARRQIAYGNWLRVLGANLAVNKQPNSNHCFICGVKNIAGAQIAFYEVMAEDGTPEVLARFTGRDLHQGFPGRMHGGVAAGVLDEVMSRCITYGDAALNPPVWGVTVEMAVRYHAPVPLGVELTARGRIVRDRSRVAETSAELFLPDGRVAVSAIGKFVKMALDQIADKVADASDALGWQVYADAS